MSNKLVAYFSASGVTKAAATRLAEKEGADLYEIVPQELYTDADLNWRDRQSRSSIEMKDPSSRPALGGDELDIAPYDEVFVGFPIWWGVAPHVVNTFLEAYDFTGKTIRPFATSGGSGYGTSNDSLKASAPGAKFEEGFILK
ncbi:MAG: flavodoxin [Eubacteriaceae bacterium]|nr:flavodoxin [Eubacteriaceae bacterium]